MNTVDLSENGPVWNKAKALYAVGKRGYHDFQHALDVLDRVDLVEKDVGFMNYEAARVAALFHDAVYVPGAKDNELLSMIEMVKVIKQEGLSPAHHLLMGDAATLIRATEQHGAQLNHFTEWDTMLFMDCDVLGFADVWPLFVEQNEKIAYEFSDVDPDKYRAGRIQFLSDLYKKGVFRSPYFRKRLEERALLNIREALNQLGVKI